MLVPHTTAAAWPATAGPTAVSPTHNSRGMACYCWPDRKPKPDRALVRNQLVSWSLATGSTGACMPPGTTTRRPWTARSRKAPSKAPNGLPISPVQSRKWAIPLEHGSYATRRPHRPSRSCRSTTSRSICGDPSMWGTGLATDLLSPPLTGPLGTSGFSRSGLRARRSPRCATTSGSWTPGAQA